MKLILDADREVLWNAIADVVEDCSAEASGLTADMILDCLEAIASAGPIPSVCPACGEIPPCGYTADGTPMRCADASDGSLFASPPREPVSDGELTGLGEETEGSESRDIGHDA